MTPFRALLKPIVAQQFPERIRVGRDMVGVDLLSRLEARNFSLGLSGIAVGMVTSSSLDKSRFMLRCIWGYKQEIVGG